jgi:hypothetical protein
VLKGLVVQAFYALWHGEVEGVVTGGGDAGRTTLKPSEEADVVTAMGPNC